MNAYILLSVECLLSLSASAAVLSALSMPLVKTLAQICPNEEAAGFWLRYTKITLVLFPFLLVLAVNMFTHFSDPLHELRLALMVILAALLLGLRAIGKRLGQFVVFPAQAGGRS